jgi:hypothetical protein
MRKDERKREKPAEGGGSLEPWKSCDSVRAEKVEFWGRSLGSGEVNEIQDSMEMR